MNWSVKTVYLHNVKLLQLHIHGIKRLNKRIIRLSGGFVITLTSWSRFTLRWGTWRFMNIRNDKENHQNLLLFLFLTQQILIYSHRIKTEIWIIHTSDTFLREAFGGGQTPLLLRFWTDPMVSPNSRRSLMIRPLWNRKWWRMEEDDGPILMWRREFDANISPPHIFVDTFLLSVPDWCSAVFPLLLLFAHPNRLQNIHDPILTWIPSKPLHLLLLLLSPWLLSLQSSFLSLFLFFTLWIKVEG